jgi:hypothetical protein
VHCAFKFSESIANTEVESKTFLIVGFFVNESKVVINNENSNKDFIKHKTGEMDNEKVDRKVIDDEKAWMD